MSIFKYCLFASTTVPVLGLQLPHSTLLRLLLASGCKKKTQQLFIQLMSMYNSGNRVLWFSKTVSSKHVLMLFQSFLSSHRDAHLVRTVCTSTAASQFFGLEYRVKWLAPILWIDNCYMLDGTLTGIQLFYVGISKVTEWGKIYWVMTMNKKHREQSEKKTSQ